jgi:hypothetical protein
MMHNSSGQGLATLFRKFYAVLKYPEATLLAWSELQCSSCKYVIMIFTLIVHLFAADTKSGSCLGRAMQATGCRASSTQGCLCMFTCCILLFLFLHGVERGLPSSVTSGREFCGHKVHSTPKEQELLCLFLEFAVIAFAEFPANQRTVSGRQTILVCNTFNVHEPGVRDGDCQIAL